LQKNKKISFYSFLKRTNFKKKKKKMPISATPKNANAHFWEVFRKRVTLKEPQSRLLDTYWLASILIFLQTWPV
jgi:hypothetical protein